ALEHESRLRSGRRRDRRADALGKRSHDLRRSAAAAAFSRSARRTRSRVLGARSARALRRRRPTRFGKIGDGAVIQSLSYIGFASPNAAAWPEFATTILGAEVAEPTADGTVRLRVDDAVARIYIHPGERNDLAYLGWAVAGPAPLDEAVRNVERHGF